jgi:peptidoglycan/LPS O-acetylase OafA/YrhL
MNRFQPQVLLEVEATRPAAAIHPKYRPDIDGLRAIAVLSVVLFHAFPDLLAGGFIGVDIFFVISGFLIGTIIVGNLEQGSFSFADFYGRRVRRIFPVLLLVLASCYAFGWFAMLADEYRQLGKHIAGGAGFVANYVLWGESGYFDNAAATKPLLHLWSLGVEEQFYIVWPALLWLACRRGLNLLSLTVVLGLASFLLNLALVHLDPVRDFYAPQTRFWQLLAGSALAALTLRQQAVLGRWRGPLDAWLGRVIYARAPAPDGSVLRDTQALLGAALIVAGLVCLSQKDAFPGWWAVLPTLGAVLVIAAGSQAWFNRVALANRLLVWVGLISFPLYLWHWPLLVLLRIAERAPPTVPQRVAAVAAAVVLAWLSYRWVERPIRSGRRHRGKTLLLLVSMAALAGVGYDTYRRDGLAFRLKDRQDYAAYFENSPAQWQFFTRLGIPEKNHFECQFFDIEKFRSGHITPVPRTAIAPGCYTRDPAKPKAVLLWGDSHAEHLSYGLRRNLPDDWQVLQVASSGCNPSLTASGPSRTDQCTQSSWFALQTIAAAHPDVVLVAQNEGHTLDNFQRIAVRLKELGVPRVIFAGPDPHWTEELPKLMMTDLWLTKPRRTFHGVDRKVLALDAGLRAGFAAGPGAEYVSVMDFFCNQDGCLTYLGDDRKTGIVSYDYGHLTPMASDLLGQRLLAPLIAAAPR